MGTTGMYTNIAFFGLLHALAALAVLAGLVFLFAWAIKTLTPKQLQQWGLGLFIGGAIVCLLSVSSYGVGHRAYKDSGAMVGMMKHQGMMDADDGAMMGMMSKMGAMLDGLEGDAFDKEFIRLMIPHHEGAVDMAKRALTSAKHPEIQKMANDIITTQQREIDAMKGWLTAWNDE